MMMMMVMMFLYSYERPEARHGS